MNQFVPDWSNNMLGDYSRPLGEDDDLIELLWCNGHVVMQSQTNRKLPPRPPEKPAAPPPPPPAAAPTAAQEDEAGMWSFPFALADSLDRDIFSDFFCDAPAAAPPPAVGPGVEAGSKPCGGGGGDDDVDVPVVPPEAAVSTEAPPRDLMPPPKSTTLNVSCSRQQTTVSLGDGGAGAGAGGDDDTNNADDLSELVRAGTARSGRRSNKAAAASSSMLSAIGSSICESNQVLVPRGGCVGVPGRASATLPSAVGSANLANAGSGRGHGHGHETTVASSSGRSNGCFGTEPTSTSTRSSSKRKRLMDTTEDDSEQMSPSEDAESESAAAARKPPQKLMTARRSRAAEVHNLSERRRRDRINEKMKALQELIPHCNKTDKASMLDEAIEYLKSLQLQVQMMWTMGSGIAAAAAPPVMVPGVHQYLPRMPFMPPQPVVPSQQVNPVPGYRSHHHMPPAVGITEPAYHYLGVNPLQPTPAQHFAQGMSYYPLGAKAVQQNPALHVPSGAMEAAAAGPGVLPPRSRGGPPGTAPGTG